MFFFFFKQKTAYEMTEGTISTAFLELSHRSGVEISPHRLRKYFDTYMALAKVNPTVLKYWVGHTVVSGHSDIEKMYIIPPTEEQRKLYVSAYDKLRVLGTSTSGEDAELMMEEKLFYRLAPHL